MRHVLLVAVSHNRQEDSIYTATPAKKSHFYIPISCYMSMCSSSCSVFPPKNPADMGLGGMVMMLQWPVAYIRALLGVSI